MYLKVILSINGNRLRTYSFDQSEILIGRGPNCQIHLDNIGVSRVHAKLVRQDRSVSVMDMESGNGTFVNSKRVHQAPLTDQDQLRIGKFIINIELVDQNLPARIPVRARPIRPQPPVTGSNTVFLRPDEARKILQHAPKALPPTIAPRKIRKPPADPIGWLGFAAGAALGLLCGWMYWG